MFLETKHLILRKFNEEDFADFCEFAIDAEMCRMMGREDIHDEESARATFDWLMNREKRGYVLVYKESGKVIGNLTITAPPSPVAAHLLATKKSGCALSFSISRHYQRRGLMQEAVTAVITQLFQVEHFDYINCGYFDFNISSAKLQQKLGFEHLLTEHFVQDGTAFVVLENILWNR